MPSSSAATGSTKDSPLSGATGAGEWIQSIGKGIQIETLGDDRRFLGLGRISVHGDSLRSARLPILPELRSPDAIRLADFQIVDSGPLADGGFGLRCNMFRSDDGPMEWMLHTVRQRYRTSDWSQPPRLAENTSLSLEIHPVERILEDETGVGFSYQYQYASEKIALYKILDRATWEPGGEIQGNEFWLRNAFAPSIHHFKSKEERYCTEWYLGSAQNPNIFEFLPFQTGLSGFTFTANEKGTLVTWVPKVAHVRSFFEKSRNSSEFKHFHELCGDLSLSFAAAPIEILWFAGKRNRIELTNLYEKIRSMVSETLHAEIGMRVERATSYGVIEEWENADLQRYRTQGLPKLAAAGTRTIFLANHFENNMNTFGVSNMCCTADWKVAESVGEENLKAFCSAATASGITVEMWGNTALSTMAFMAHKRDGREARLRFSGYEKTLFHELDDTTDAWVRNPSNAIEADHYSPVFVALNLRDETVRRIWMERWSAAQKLGLGGIFLDSSFNLSSDKFHWTYLPAAARQSATADQTQLFGDSRPEQEPLSSILSQYGAHLSLMVEMQKVGYVYCGEDIGIFGIHRASGRLDDLVRSLPLWVDCLPEFDPVELRRLGADPDDIFFRALAYRVVWKLFWDPKSDELTWNPGKAKDPDHAPTDSQLTLLTAYNVVQPYMDKRTVLKDERGVVYYGNGKTVLWAFTSFTFSFSGDSNEVEDVLGKRKLKIDHLETSKPGIYLLDGIRKVAV